MQRTTLSDFFNIMQLSKELRVEIVNSHFQGVKLSKFIKPLTEFKTKLENIEKKGNKFKLHINVESYLTTDLSYEINEIKKDIIFCYKGFDGLIDYHKNQNAAFEDEVRSCSEFIESSDFKHFISDRDGTINNYSGRYQSSIQSAYNAIALTQFVKKHLLSSTILTSAPLKNTGILDVNVSPEESFIFAGSKGREFIYNGKLFQLKIDETQKSKLQVLNDSIIALTNNEKYKKFTLIGSGLQFKFGQTTIARQDITGAIPESESNNLLLEIEKIIESIDPGHQFFRIEDTGKDIEIILTVKSNNSQLKDFDKGDGVEFINETLQLGFEKDGCLVCGDTHSDISMVKKLLSINDSVFTIFVTKNTRLINDLKKQFNTKRLHIVSTPDVLITALAKIS